MKKLKVVTILGTRPEIIRLSRLIALLDQETEHTVIHTGQNFDANLSDVFFSDLELRLPDIHLNADNSSLGTALGSIFREAETALLEIAPDAVLILGDTNSALVAIVVRRLGIPVFHMEAGNRSFDQRVPEELNRRVVDHISNFNLPYSEFARENLLREGIHPNTICKTGSPMPEVLRHINPRVEESKILQTLGVSPSQYFLVSAHRQETVNNRGELTKLFGSMALLAQESGLPIVVSTHPRLKSMIAEHHVDIPANVILCEPFGYIDYLKLQKNANCVLSDSGTISEESSVLGFPAITIRDSFERQEASETGSIILAGLDYAKWRRAIDATLHSPAVSKPLDYQVTDFAARVYKFMLSKVAVN